ncbi:MAG: hypothetical protein ACTSVU_05565 [Promethearchaeota archaeon]
MASARSSRKKSRSENRTSGTERVLGKGPTRRYMDYLKISL